MWTRIRTALRKVVPFLFPAAVLLVFGAVLNSGPVLKRPFGQHDDIEGIAVRIERAVNENRWEEAEALVQPLNRAIDLVGARVQLIAEREELHGLAEHLTLLRGGLATRDSTSALQEIAMIKYLYAELGQ